MTGTSCQACGTELAEAAPACPRCGVLAGPSPWAGQQDPGQAAWRGGQPGGPATAQPRPLMSLATWLTVMLAAFAIATLTGFAVSAFDVAGLVLLLAIMPVFLVWLYRASGNAHASGCPQRRSAGWAIGGWFVPVIFLWFPYQAVADIWRAGQPPERRAGVPWLVAAWWACWLLAWVTGFQYTRKPGSIRVNEALYSTSGSRISIVIAAAALILIVRTVSASPLGAGQAGT